MSYFIVNPYVCKKFFSPPKLQDTKLARMVFLTHILVKFSDLLIWWPFFIYFGPLSNQSIMEIRHYIILKT